MSIFVISEKTDYIGNQFELEVDDPSLNVKRLKSFECEYKLDIDYFNRLFFRKYNLEYISCYLTMNGLEFRVLTHPRETNTCFEKAELLGSWDSLNIIKTLYFEYSGDNALYALVIPETGCFVDREMIKEILEIPGDGFLRKAETIPQSMSFGTCSPFILESDLLKNGGKVAKIVFDTETLEMKKDEQHLDDFSFGLDHRMSLQVNYYNCYLLLKEMYPDVVENKGVMNLSFKEKFIRKNGKLSIHYDFNSINYKTAKFINSIHGYGNVSIINDYIDELDLPRLLSACMVR